MLEIKSNNGEVELSMSGTVLDIIADTIVVLKAIYDNLDDNSDAVRTEYIKQIVAFLTGDDCSFFEIEADNRDVSDEASFTVGTKVEVTDGLGFKHTGTIINVSGFREPDMKYAVDVGLDDVVFVGEGSIRLVEVEE